MHRPAARAHAPGAVLSAALTSMSLAGTVYWAPALSAALGGALRLSAGGRAAFVASFNVAYVVSWLPGMLQDAVGPRRASALGSGVLVLSYAALAALAWLRPHRPLLFAAPLGVSISMASFAVYAAATSSGSAAYPSAARGRVNGLLASIHAMSAGLMGAFQAAFFPTAAEDPRAVVRLLLFVSVLCSIPGLVSRVYPDSLSAAADAREGEALLGAPARPRVVDDRSISAGYGAAVTIALVLQLCALADWVGVDARVRGVRTQVALVGVLLLLLPALGLPAASAYWGGQAGGGRAKVARALLSVGGIRGRGGHSDGDEDLEVVEIMDDCTRGESSGVESEDCLCVEQCHEQCSLEQCLPFWDLVRAPHFWFMFGMVAAVSGFGGLALQNTTESLIAARLLSGERLDHARGAVTGEAIARGVRAVVIFFSSASVSGRLIVGLIADAPRKWNLQPSKMSPCRWRYTLVQLVTGLMMVGMLMCAYSSSWMVLWAAGVVGLAHGMGLSVLPSLSQDFFGVESFPRDFALIGIGAAIGCTIAAWASYVDVGRALREGSWADVAASKRSDVLTRYCTGPACYRGTYNLCVGMMLVALILTFVFKRRLLVDR